VPGSPQDQADDDELMCTGTSHEPVHQPEGEEERCSKCGGMSDVGMMTCRVCKMDVHSFCYYKRRSEEEEEAIDLGELWECDTCAKKESVAKAVPGGSQGAEDANGRLDSVANGLLDGKQAESGRGGRGEGAASSVVSKPKSDRQIVRELGYDITGGILQKKKPRKRDYAVSEGSQEGLVNKALKTQKEKGGKEASLGNHVDEMEGDDGGGGGWGGGGGAEETDRLLGMLEGERESLTHDRNRKQAQAEGVTDGMMEDVQTMLEMFGIPYVLSPTEAESQCAMLEQVIIPVLNYRALIYHP
jgi:hypothetical protein